MTDRGLMALGFTPHGDGSLHPPARITLMPSGEFFRLTLALPSGDVLTCHISKLALKICKGPPPVTGQKQGTAG